MKTLLSAIWVKIVAGMGVIIGVMAIRAKWQASKIENLEEENAGLGKLNEINSTIEKAEIKAEKIEKEKLAKVNDSDWRDKI